MKQVSFYYFVAMLVFQSCNQSLPRTDVSANSVDLPQLAGTTPAMGELPGSRPTVAAPKAKLNPAHGMPGHRCDIAVGAPLNSAPAFQTTLPASAVSGQPLLNIPRNPALPAIQAAQPNITVTPAAVNTTYATAAGLNPKHGEPGHRCDIPVGAPLNSPPGKVTTASVSQPTTASVANGLNPKHGEPGHRCDIPVGASLSTPPRQSTATTAVTTPAVTTSAAANTKFDPLAGNNTPADGLNPKHGEPGHRCDIAVGAPLPKK